MKRMLFCFAAALCLAVTAVSLGEETEWSFGLSAETVANKQGYMTLANKDHLLDEDYEPLDLVNVGVKTVVRDAQLRKEAASALKRMFDAALEDGYTLYVKSAYRSYGTQKTMYSNRLKNLGRDDGMVQYPGASDHQTGLGVDVLNYAWTQKDGMNAKFGNEPEAQWMAAHCHEYGFVIRYEADKEEITGIRYEPWHLRYVGIETAQYMVSAHLCLEELHDRCQAAVEEYEAAGRSFEALVRKLNMPGEIVILEMNEFGEEEYSVFH